MELEALWALLTESLTAKGEWHRAYNLVNAAFMQCLNFKTEVAGTVFVGPFAKTDYLLKENGASVEMSRNINSTRVRLRKRFTLKENVLAAHFLTDFCHVCRFIAFVYGVEVPDNLAEAFPLSAALVSGNAEKPKENTERPEDDAVEGKHEVECLRVIVDRVEGEKVYGRADMTDDVRDVCVSLTTPNGMYSFDWNYLVPMLYPGAQLNVIRPRERDGVIYPELIILDPDNLVDISAIAQCFAAYAESPMVHLIRRITPSASIVPIILGNLAGQILDEELHRNGDEEKPYLETVMEFYRHNALQLATADIDSDFHKEAQSQKKNIDKALHESLPQMLKRFNSADVMVEPSFFSEMLGVQGRMDFLQLDHKVLLEQKSGKGEWIPNNTDPDTPLHKEQHYVQMLLYMQLLRYNHHDRYVRNNRELHAFLLYSKYRNSLVGLGFSPELTFRALKIRNGIVDLERRLAMDDGYAILSDLYPDDLNMKKVGRKLWEEFLRPPLDELLIPIHKATALEFAYFKRMMTFVSREHLLAKYGNMTKENSGFAAKWHDSLEDKLHAGNIYCNLALVSPDTETEGKVSSVRLSFDETASHDMSNFRVGDAVALYSYNEGEEPDIRRNMVFRSSVASITASEIELRLRTEQTDAKVFLREENQLWAIEHDFIESSFSTLYKGIYSFLTAPQHRRDLLLFQRQPQVDEKRRLKGDYGSFNELALRVKQAKDMFLIIGPPGTGKTSYGMLNTLKEELLETDSQVLLTSYTNRAVDEICSKLHAEGIDFIRIGGSLSCSPVYRDHLLDEKVMQTRNVNELRNVIQSCRVIVGTTSTLSNVSHMLFKLKHFSLAIIDEASQILEPHLLMLLSAQNDMEAAISKFVMIGDHKQLPAVVQQTHADSSVSDELLRSVKLRDCRLSLFERILLEYGDNPQVRYMLTRQGRMHRDIAAFPNVAFYENRLDVVPLPHQVETTASASDACDVYDKALFHSRSAFIDVPLPEKIISDKVNIDEAELIVKLVMRIYEHEKERFDAEETVGIIVPYRNQIATVRQLLDLEGIPVLRDITIDTVERFQGSQRRYIIYGFTVQRAYQLHFLTNNNFEDAEGNIIDRKLNVAMTRAKEHLVIVGNEKLLRANPVYCSMLDYIDVVTAAE